MLVRSVPISRADEIDGMESAIRKLLPDGAAAKAYLDTQELEPEEYSSLWSRFAANERSAMKERREVRKGRNGL